MAQGHDPSVVPEQFRTLAQSLLKIESSLHSGGPPVVWAEVVTYVNGRLAEGERRGEVERNILTWRAWFDAFWEVIETRVESEDCGTVGLLPTRTRNGRLGTAGTEGPPARESERAALSAPSDIDIGVQGGPAVAFRHPQSPLHWHRLAWWSAAGILLLAGQAVWIVLLLWNAQDRERDIRELRDTLFTTQQDLRQANAELQRTQGDLKAAQADADDARRERDRATAAAQKAIHDRDIALAVVGIVAHVSEPVSRDADGSAANQNAEDEHIASQIANVFVTALAESETVEDRLRAARATFRLGVTQRRAKHDYEGTRKTYEKAARLFLSVVKDRPKELGYERELAVTYIHLGDLARERGYATDARSAYRDATDRLKRLVDADKQNRRFKRDLAAVLVNNANLLRTDRTTLAEAERGYEQALSLWEELLADERESVDFRHEWAKAAMNLGIVVRTNTADPERFKKAEKAFSGAIKALKKLREQSRSSPNAVTRDLAVAYFNLGVLLTEEPERRDEAVDVLQTAIGLQRGLTAAESYSPDRWYELAGSANALGNVFENHRRYSEAEGAYRLALASYARIETHVRSTPNYQAGRSATYAMWARLLRKQAAVGKAVEGPAIVGALAAHPGLLAVLPACADEVAVREKLEGASIALENAIRDIQSALQRFAKHPDWPRYLFEDYEALVQTRLALRQEKEARAVLQNLKTDPALGELLKSPPFRQRLERLEKRLESQR